MLFFVAMTKRKIFYAIALLLAYLPAVLLSSLHTHEQALQEPVRCLDCVNHNHHSGHIDTAFAHHDCLLCQFMQQTYVGNASDESDAVLLSSEVRYGIKAVKIQSCERLCKSPRAPPILL